MRCEAVAGATCGLGGPSIQGAVGSARRLTGRAARPEESPPFGLGAVQRGVPPNSEGPRGSVL